MDLKIFDKPEIEGYDAQMSKKNDNFSFFNII